MVGGIEADPVLRPDQHVVDVGNIAQLGPHIRIGESIGRDHDACSGTDLHGLVRQSSTGVDGRFVHVAHTQ